MSAMVFAACGSDSTNQPDPYYGTVDATVLDAKVLPFSDFTGKICTSGSPCYAPQQGFLHGKPFYFYNMGTVTKLGALSPSVVTNTQYNFSGNCGPGPTTDPQADAYPRDVQYPIFSGIPAANPSTAVTVYPLVKVQTVSSVSGDVCNDLKSAGSLLQGKYGASISPTIQYAFNPVVDLQAPFLTKGKLTVTPKMGWFNGLQVRYVEGGSVPLDVQGNLRTMDGVIMDPPKAANTPQAFAKTTDAQAVLLQYQPGDPNYSPIVRLYDASYSVTQGLGFFTGICHGSDPSSPACGATDVDIDALKAATTFLPFNTIFIVASPQ